MRRLAPLTVLLALVAAPAAADAAPVSFGTSTLRLDAGSALLAGGSTVAVRQGAARKGRSVALPVSAGRVTTTATLSHRGTIAIRRGRRSLTLAHLRLVVGAPTVLSAQAGGRRIALATATGTGRRLNASGQAVGLTAAPLTLAREAATILQRRLRLRRRPAGRVGALTVDARLVGAPAPATPAGGDPGGAVTPGAAPGAPVGPANPSAPVPPAPPVERPADPNVRQVVSGTLTWRLRDSFVDYLDSDTTAGRTGENTSAADGAAGGAQEPRETGVGKPLTRRFSFPFKGGFYNPVTRNGTIDFGGAVRFRHTAHGIDWRVREPSLTVGSETPRTDYFLQRAGAAESRSTLVDLVGAQAGAPTVSEDGRTFTFERLDAKVAPGAADTFFGGFYPAGDPFGSYRLELVIAP